MIFANINSACALLRFTFNWRIEVDNHEPLMNFNGIELHVPRISENVNFKFIDNFVLACTLHMPHAMPNEMNELNINMLQLFSKLFTHIGRFSHAILSHIQDKYKIINYSIRLYKIISAYSSIAPNCKSHWNGAEFNIQQLNSLLRAYWRL